jgi:hypothetical protein
LKLHNLIAIEYFIIENLPLLGGPLVEVALAFADLLLTKDVFNPHFELNKNLTSARLVKETGGTAVTPLHINLLVF